MTWREGRFSVRLAVFAITLLASGSAGGAAIVADHNGVAVFDSIPVNVIEDITANYNVHYVHTSHGSQIMTGLAMLEAEDALYDRPYFHETGDDLGHVGDTSWVPGVRAYLDANPSCNMAMFSWCGGCSDNTETGINTYLAKMEDLEADYPGHIFIYMTGHLDGGGVDGNLYRSNNQIRDYCVANDKILFDFADIESWNPLGVYYPDESDGCGWCSDWCANHDCPTCGGCAHSHCYNCYLKGKGWWYMMARIEGWDVNIQDCCDNRGDINHRDYPPVDISDLVYFVNYMFGSGPAPICASEANVDGAGTPPIDVADMVYLVNYMFQSGPAPVPCE